jgi:hypothetical protein
MLFMKNWKNMVIMRNRVHIENYNNKLEIDEMMYLPLTLERY